MALWVSYRNNKLVYPPCEVGGTQGGHRGVFTEQLVQIALLDLGFGLGLQRGGELDQGGASVTIPPGTVPRGGGTAEISC